MTEKFQLILENNILKKEVKKELGLSSFPAVLKAEQIPESNLIEVKVTAATPEMAFRVLKIIQDKDSALSELVLPDVVMETIQQPEVSGLPDKKPSTKKQAGVVFLTAAVLGTVFVAFCSSRRDTIKKEEDFESKVIGDLLGTICHEKKEKKNGSMLINNPLRSFSYTEGIRMTAARIRRRMEKKEAKILLITSVAEHEGKSTLAANIALALAEEGRRILLLDCDFRRPALSEIFGLPEEMHVDFGDVLEGKEPESGMFRQVGNMTLYTGFCRKPLPDPSEKISGERFQQILSISRPMADFIILDSPPMGIAADAEELCRMADAVVLVVHQDFVRSRDINDALDILNQESKKGIGCVMTDVRRDFRKGFRKEPLIYPGYGPYKAYTKIDR